MAISAPVTGGGEGLAVAVAAAAGELLATRKASVAAVVERARLGKRMWVFMGRAGGCLWLVCWRRPEQGTVVACGGVSKWLKSCICVKNTLNHDKCLELKAELGG